MSSFSGIRLNQWSLRRWIAAAPLMFALVAPAYAGLLSVQVSCVENNLDGQTGGNRSQPCTTVSETNPGTLTASAPVTTALSGSGPSSSFSASATAKANYGSLGISAAVSLQRTEVLPDPFSLRDARTTAVVATAISHWDDRVTISGTPGAFADVQVNYVFDIHSFNATALASGFAFGFGIIELQSTSQPGGMAWCVDIAGTGGDPCGFPGTYTRLTVGTNLISFTTQMAVGVSIPWQVNLSGQVGVQPIDYFDIRAADASAAFDALNTVDSYFTVLTPGATMQWDSGHDYSLPSPAAVPEPEIYAMLGVGLGLMGWVRRRRKVAA